MAPLVRGAVLSAVFLLPPLLGLLFHPNLPREITNASRLRIAFAFLLSLLVAVGGLRKGSLDKTAVPLVLALGWVVTVSNAVFCLILVAFFVLGSKATTAGESIKEKFDGEFKKGGQRNWIQVLCNGGVVALLALMHLVFVGHGELPIAFPHPQASENVVPTPRIMLHSWIHLAALGAVAACAADTISSELSPIVSSTPPVLITLPWRFVPVGTNGGVTLVGFVLSALGGAAIGLVDFLATLMMCWSTEWSLRWLLVTQWPVLPISALAGVLGSTIDSLLGATLQFSGVNQDGKIVEVPAENVRRIAGVAILDNGSVNLLSSALTAAISAFFVERFLL